MRGQEVRKGGWREGVRGILREVRRVVVGEVMGLEVGKREVNSNRRNERTCSREASVSREGK